MAINDRQDFDLETEYNMAMEELERSKVEAEDVAGQPEPITSRVDKKDAVNQPSHYDWFGDTAYNIISKILTFEELIGALKFNSLKYRMRAGEKTDSCTQDIEKAKWYENKYNELVYENTQNMK